MSTLGQTRETNTLLPPPGFQPFYADLTVFPLVSRLSRKLHDPKIIAHSSICNAFPNVQTKRPKPNCIPEAKANPRSEIVLEAKASLRKQTNARIPSAYSKINLCSDPPRISDSKPMPQAGAIRPVPQRIIYQKPQTSALPEAN